MLTVVDFVGVYQKARRTARNRLRTRDMNLKASRLKTTARVKLKCLLSWLEYLPSETCLTNVEST